MTSQGWIFDPPPPPPPKRTAEDVRKDQQSSNPGRGSSQGTARGGGGYVRHGSRNFGGARGNYQRQQRSQNAGPVQTYSLQTQQGYPPMMYGVPYGAHPQPQMMYPPLQQGFPQAYPSYPIQETPPAPVQQHHKARQEPRQPRTQPPPAKPPVKIQNPDHSGRRLPVYAPPTPKRTTKTSKPKKNALGYSMSSTAYSLPEHHVIPIGTGPPEMSEEELRFSLEMTMKGKEPSLMIQGTNIVLRTVEDIMAWRDQRKRRWLKKIAKRDLPKLKRKKNETDQGKSISRNIFEASASSSEDELALELKLETDSKPAKGERKAKKRKMITKKAKEELEIKSPDEDDGKSLYVKMLENQMERENIILLQTLLHFREHGLLELN